ncbi:hypothetical protein RS030_6746 [Cryptosporidium xiaoi]|uniref:DNA repair protein RAD2 n=1 Tax=Cryptosporidium xiaoi TaxID=659607 RepID=A0AAV9XUK7_9CRYT
MGVKGLWDIVSPSGIRVKPESLEGQTLAIDASIWLKQFLIGIKDGEGNIPRGAHLLGFFKRICKLLYYGISPVVVFDGAPPEIKKRTLEQRRMQRELSEINVRRVANKLLLNSIRLRVAKGIKSKIRNLEDNVDNGDKKSEMPSNNDDCRINLFSSESDSDEDYIRDGDNEFVTNTSTSLFPVMGFLSERRKLDEMPEIDTNLFKMPISNNSRNKRKVKKLTNVDDFSAYMKKNSDIVDERRLVDLPLDTEIDPQVFEQLNSKLQYEILIQLRDAWLSSLRMNAVNTKDNMNQFSNSQMECYLRYLRINQEIEKLKLRMAKECEGQIEGGNNGINLSGSFQDSNEDKVEKFTEFDGIETTECSKVLGTDELVDNFGESNKNINTCIINEAEGKIMGNSTLMDKVYNYSISRLNDNIESKVSSKKGNCCIIPSKLNKKERTEYLKSTNYNNKDAFDSNPLNTPLFELEKLFQIRKSDIEDKYKINVSNSIADECLNNSERIELLKENVDELFNLNNSKDDKVSRNTYSLDDNTNNVEKEETDTDWEDIEWVNIGQSTEKSDLMDVFKSKILSNDMMLNLDSELDNILSSGPTKINYSKTGVIEKRIKLDTDDKSDFKTSGEKYDILDSETDSDKDVEIQSKIDKTDENEKIKELYDIIDDEYDSKDELLVNNKLILENYNIEASEKEYKVDENEINEQVEVEEKKNKEERPIIDEIKGTVQVENMLFNELSVNNNEIEELLLELEKEQDELNTQYKKQSVTLNSEITKEIKYQVCMLLEAFGIPWIESPGEAEAQASLLTKLNICNGVLSDDSDCLIFGAKKVYRNFFSGTCTEMYDIENIKKFLGIKRQDQLYILALLLGCDYTVGVNGVGPVNALEILKAYPELDDMILFKNWSLNKLEDKSSELLNESIERAEFKRNHMNYRHSWVFPSDFPCLSAINAMRNPNVNHNFKPKFGNIEKESIIQIMTNNTDLDTEKVSTIIDSIVKNQVKTKNQTKIYDFLQNNCNNEQLIISREEKVASIVSKRMKKALLKR